ncbi:MAG: enoyl-CoA hydratase/isomerase family protein [Rhodocyclaceae bacterium]|nr:enoyl-CoA hydratase/isomerase family protein [Rhodocyclaceae bacterium]MBX3670905.1 enoyl-CoA hydratase/isomerase family protein [Rhodocyclaceae bacterium]
MPNAPAAHVSWTYDAELAAIWLEMAPDTPFLTWDLARELRAALEDIRRFDAGPLKWLILSSATPGAFLLGGDVDALASLAAKQDVASLSRYADECAAVFFSLLEGADRGLVTISLVDGLALSAGMELALACQLLVATDNASFGLPETDLGISPASAHALISRKANPGVARRLILAERRASAARLHELGLIDELVPAGQGKAAVVRYIKANRKRVDGMKMYFELQRLSTLAADIQELQDGFAMWSEAIGKLSVRDVRKLKAVHKLTSGATA